MGTRQFAVATTGRDEPVSGLSRARLDELSLNRDFSQVEFYRRVLDEARDESNPLLERVKFLTILGIITNEFSTTRCAEIPAATLKRVEAEIEALLCDARQHLREHLAPALASEGIHLLKCAELHPKERAEVEAYFADSILPVLMPLGFDAARPFPHVTGRTTALAVVIRRDGQEQFACLQVPESIPGLVPFHWRRAETAATPGHALLEQGFVWTHDLIAANLDAVFPGMEILGVYPFRVFRDASLDAETGLKPCATGVAQPFRAVEDVERGLRRREFGDVLSLIVDEAMPAWLTELLVSNLALAPQAVRVRGDLTDLAGLAELSRLDRPDLRDRPLGARLADLSRRSAEGAKADLFASIRQADILLHHPFDSFQPVVGFLEQAASDPGVLAISTTLYRAGRSSPVVEALLRARRAGKQVRVVIELRARFDEGNNLAWGRALENAGAHVVYGIAGLKVHAKLTLVVRREAGKIRRYVHLSSGNYNQATSGVYTDLGLLTCRDDIGHDATQVFNVLSGYAAPESFRTLLVAPFTLRSGVQALIEREAELARRGQAAHMILKMNALSDPEIIERLYAAAQAGVRIDLIVRGICCLRPGVPGISDHIRVRSIVGRFLEHSRAWYFHNGGREEVYMGSADLMPRNLGGRVEVMARLDDGDLKARVRGEILAAYLADNVKARELMSDGSYLRAGRESNAAVINSQECLL